MGEEKKEESKGEEKKEESKQDEKKKEEEPQENIVLKVDMHCEACARKVARALKGFEGVEEVAADSKGSKVVVKGKKANPIKVVERLQKKSGRKVELISPLPKPPSEEKKEEIKEEPKEEKKEEPPAVVTVHLKVHMHCEACAQVLQKRIRKIKGVETVETDVRNDRVIVKGVVDPTNLVKSIYKKTRKQVFIVKDEGNKEEEKKEPEKKEGEGDKKKEDKGKGDGEGNGNGEEDDDEKKMRDMKRSEYYPSKDDSVFAYNPQIFSDENPNACSLM